MSYRKNDLQNRTKGEYTQNDIKKAWQSCLPVFICNSEVFLLAAGKVSEVQLEMFPHREGLISCRAALQLLLSLSSCVWERAAQLMSDSEMRVWAFITDPAWARGPSKQLRSRPLKPTDLNSQITTSASGECYRGASVWIRNKPLLWTVYLCKWIL